MAEAAKVIENTQRDLNVALMNELAIICDRLGIRTHDVLAAAGTPNGISCLFGRAWSAAIVSVSTLTTSLHVPKNSATTREVILAGRRINDDMPVFIAPQDRQALEVQGGWASLPAPASAFSASPSRKMYAICATASRVPELVRELESFGLTALSARSARRPRTRPTHDANTTSTFTPHRARKSRRLGTGGAA